MRLSALPCIALTAVIAAAGIGSAEARSPLATQSCHHHTTSAEVAICSSYRLRRLDRKLNTTYRALRETLSRRAFAGLRREQFRWLGRRNACTANHRCLVRHYRSRLRILRARLRAARFDDRPRWQPTQGPFRPVVPVANQRCEGERRMRSLNSRAPTKITFVNRARSEEDVYKIYWIDFNGRRKLYRTLFKGQRYVQPTYMTHPWVITSPIPGGGELCIRIVMPDPGSRRVVLG
ncbi:MAG: lysozyme inhibitor LprI family protein [Pseudomonadota bacterium]